MNLTKCMSSNEKKSFYLNNDVFRLTDPPLNFPLVYGWDHWLVINKYV